jgi:predicted transcriptional regulator
MSTMSAGPPDLDAPEREFLRHQAKLLFGNRDRVEVAIAIARSNTGMVNAAELSYEIGLQNNRIRAQLKTLADAGLLQEMPREASGRVWYERRDSSFWDACLELQGAWERKYLRSRS